MKSMREVFKSLLVTEAFRNSDFNAARTAISSYLKKYKVYVFPIADEFNIEGSHYVGLSVWTGKTDNGAYLLWKKGPSSTELDAVTIFDDVDNALSKTLKGGKIKSNVYFEPKGASIVKVLPLVKDLVLGNIPMNQDAVLGAVKGWQLWESKEDELPINESTDTEVASLKKEYWKLYSKRRRYEKYSKEWNDFSEQMDSIKNKYQKLEMNIKSGVSVHVEARPEIPEEKEFEERIDWRERFKDMQSYVSMVCRGIKPSAILCGAPGVGKTFRVKQMLRANGKVMSRGNKAIGDNWYMSKGSETPLSLYTKLFQYKEPGDIVVFDDCDKVIQSEDAINLIKAATDSDDERIIAYGTSRPPEMPEALIAQHPEWEADCVQDSKGRWYYPTNFEFKGSVIIITNLRAGQLDTAIRNRALMCDLDFTSDEVLEIVEEIGAAIQPNMLTPESKKKALDFLKKLSAQGENLEISLRSFATCAGFFVDCDDDAAAERRIKEQMRLQFMRGGKRY